MSVRSLSLSNLVAIWLETFLYGIYVVTLVPTVYVILHCPFSDQDRAPHKGEINYQRFVIVMLLFMFATTHIASGLAMLLDAFIFFPDFSSESYFIEVTNPLSILRTVAFLSCVLLSDGLLIHRIYILWARSKIATLLPSLNLVLAIVSGILVLTLSHSTSSVLPLSASSPASIFLSTALGSANKVLLPAHVAMLFTTNLSITALILLGERVRKKNNYMQNEGYTRRRKSLILGETGIVYTITALVTLFLSLVGSNGQIIPYLALTPLSAMSSTLAILMVQYELTPFQAHGIPALARPVKGLSMSPSAEETNPGPSKSPSAVHTMSFVRQSVIPSLESTTSACISGTIPAASLLPAPLVERRKQKQTQFPPPLVLARHRPETSPPPVLASSPPPSAMLTSAFETHFPRGARIDRVSQQTFNPRRSNAGKGGTVYTTFGNSSLAIMLAAGSNDERVQSAVSDSFGYGESDGLDKGKKKEKKLTPQAENPDLSPGSYDFRFIYLLDYYYSFQVYT
ncbi:hypothetical protein K439DRAFT_1191406 [Ramaria rubella]|nr:hypothetical protein K439DRAFT_1191406 [Ramaria rubella]